MFRLVEVDGGIQGLLRSTNSVAFCRKLLQETSADSGCRGFDSPTPDILAKHPSTSEDPIIVRRTRLRIGHVSLFPRCLSVKSCVATGQPDSDWLGAGYGRSVRAVTPEASSVVVLKCTSAEVQ